MPGCPDDVAYSTIDQALIDAELTAVIGAGLHNGGDADPGSHDRRNVGAAASAQDTTLGRSSRRAVDMAIDIVEETHPPPATRLQNNLTRAGHCLAHWLSSLVSWPEPNTSS